METFFIFLMAFIIPQYSKKLISLPNFVVNRPYSRNSKFSLVNCPIVLMPSLRQTCLQITVPSILILWRNRIGSWRNSDIVVRMHLSENLANDEKTSRQKGFTALRLENRNLDPLYFCRSRSGTSSFSRAIHLLLSSFSIFLIRVTFKLSIKTFISVRFKPPSTKNLHSVVHLILSLLPFHISL